MKSLGDEYNSKHRNIVKEHLSNVGGATKLKLLKLDVSDKSRPGELYSIICHCLVKP